jgi:hypothetical protein
MVALIPIGCAGQRESTVGALPMATAAVGAQRHVSSKSWLKSESSAKDLLYVSSADGNVYVYFYPQGQLAGTLTGFIDPLGECVDSSGDIFITSYSNFSFTSSTIYEYAHGGTSPISALNDPGVAYGCAIDSTTGDLAVANSSDNTNPYKKGYGDVAIFHHAEGTPTMYYDRDSPSFYYYCGYDLKGNLYVSAFFSQNEDRLVTLPQGATSLEAISLDKKIYSSFDFEPSVQWDGNNVTVSSAPKHELHGRGSISVYRLKLLGKTGSVIGTTVLDSKKNHHGGQSWIQGKTIVGVDFYKGYGNVGLWLYPKGGAPYDGIKKIAPRTGGELWGVTVSAASLSR